MAHNLDRSTEKTAIAIDNIRVAMCDPRLQNDIQLDNSKTRLNEKPGFNVKNIHKNLISTENS